MFKELKLKIAARRVERKKARKNVRNTRRNNSVWRRIWNAICWPFRLIGRAIRKLWAWIRSIDLIGLVNLTLLVAIIVLFSMLIIDICGCRREQVVVIGDAPAIAVQGPRNAASAKMQDKPALPLRRDAKTRKFVDTPIYVATTRSKVAPTHQTIQGSVTIDRNPDSPLLSEDVHIYGDLYLQHMRKYTLPCGTVVYGNLFLRDVDMLQFCGDFTVTGNIYVSPRSSFGPIPRTARLGGQVIL